MSYTHYRLCSYAHTIAKAIKLHWRYRPQQLRRIYKVLLQLNAAVDKPHIHRLYRNVLD